MDLGGSAIEFVHPGHELATCVRVQRADSSQVVKCWGDQIPTSGGVVSSSAPIVSNIDKFSEVVSSSPFGHGFACGIKGGTGESQCWGTELQSPYGNLSNTGVFQRIPDSWEPNTAKKGDGSEFRVLDQQCKAISVAVE